MCSLIHLKYTKKENILPITLKDCRSFGRIVSKDDFLEDVEHENDVSIALVAIWLSKLDNILHSFQGEHSYNEDSGPIFWGCGTCRLDRYRIHQN